MQICLAPLAEFKRKNCNTARIEITRYFYHETSSPVRIVAVRYINGYGVEERWNAKSLGGGQYYKKLRAKHSDDDVCAGQSILKDWLELTDSGPFNFLNRFFARSTRISFTHSLCGRLVGLLADSQYTLDGSGVLTTIDDGGTQTEGASEQQQHWSRR